MDLTTIIGLVLSPFIIFGGMVIEGGHAGSLLQITAFYIVFGGTVAAIVTQCSVPHLIGSLRMVKWMFFTPPTNCEAIITQVVGWSQTVRREGMLALEKEIDTLDDPFMRKGAQMLVDGIKEEDILERLSIELDTWEEEQRQCSRIWEAAGGYSPTMGIMGAVMGLIHTMENLADTAKVGGGIAVAFVATVYGIGLANMVYLPIYKKTMSIISKMVTYRQMFLEGIAGIAAGENPRMVESRMQSHLV